MHDTFDNLMRFLTKTLGLDASQANDSLYMLEFDGLKLCFRLLPQAGTALLFADLGPLPEKGREALYERLLKANHALFETGGATLSANRNLNMVALQCMLPVETLDGQAFVRIVENFLAVGRRWHAECKEYASLPAPAATGDVAQSSTMLRV